MLVVALGQTESPNQSLKGWAMASVFIIVGVHSSAQAEICAGVYTVWVLILQSIYTEPVEFSILDLS
jgi:hypothetical protein